MLGVTDQQRLQQAIDETRATFLRNAARLAEWQRRNKPWRGADALPEATPIAIFTWLTEVTTVVSSRYGDLAAASGSGGSSCYARAHLRENQVRMNPSFIRSERYTDADLLDLTLHEFGHLAAWRFCRDRGHQAPWQNLGYVVGYVPIGSTDMSYRRRYGQAMVTYKMAAALGHPHPTLGF